MYYNIALPSIMPYVIGKAIKNSNMAKFPEVLNKPAARVVTKYNAYEYVSSIGCSCSYILKKKFLWNLDLFGSGV